MSGRSIRWPDADAERGRHRAFLLLAIALCAATVTLAWFGFVATRNLQDAARQRLLRQTDSAQVLLEIALDRDMKGAWLSVLVPIELSDIRNNPPYDFQQLSARAFARFSYLESFIVWKQDGHPGGLTYLFNRADRSIPWAPTERALVPYPAILVQNPAPMRGLVSAIRRQAVRRHRFVLIETSLAGARYQIVAHLIFGQAANQQLVAFVGFLVNLDWVRQHYFGELLRQIAALAGGTNVVSLAVTDQAGHAVATSGSVPASAPVVERSFPLLFLDQRLLSSTAGSHPPIQQWTAWVRPTASAAAAAHAADERTFLLIACSAVAAVVSLLLMLRALQARAELAAMKSEFVATVTHELKTPLASIKLVGETLERGRYSSTQVVREYAGLLAQETNRLGQLIDNLLSLSRMSDPGQVYTFEAIEVVDLVEDALEQFCPRLNQLGFHITVDIEPNLPPARVDRTAMLLVLGNLIDNAINYSGTERELSIGASAAPDGVSISVADAGRGIAPDDQPKVFNKFFRGHGVKAGGSGLGLTIAQRIVQGHGGRIVISSALGTGTKVEVVIPAAEA